MAPLSTDRTARPRPGLQDLNGQVTLPILSRHPEVVDRHAVRLTRDLISPSRLGTMPRLTPEVVARRVAPKAKPNLTSRYHRDTMPPPWLEARVAQKAKRSLRQQQSPTYHTRRAKPSLRERQSLMYRLRSQVRRLIHRARPSLMRQRSQAGH